jgi:hypothetical protein
METTILNQLNKSAEILESTYDDSIPKSDSISEKTFLLRNDSAIVLLKGIGEIEATYSLTERLVRQRGGAIINENWSKSQLLSARILKVTKDFISCECLISKSQKITQLREFPALLFSHITPLEENTFVKIKISQKPGSFRTDIIDGRNLGIEKDFEMIDLWKDLEDFGEVEPL